MQDVLNIIFDFTKNFFSYLLNFEIFPGLDILTLIIGFLILVFFVKFVFNMSK